MKNNISPNIRRALLKLVMVCLVLVIVLCAVRLYQSYEQARQDRLDAERWASLAAETPEETTPAETPRETEPETEPPYVSPINFEELSKVNPEIVGWLTIPGTNVDYPVVQTTDNETYLHKSFDGQDSKAGTIFLDSDSNSDFTGRNNVIYGHHMRDGSMFKDVVKFKEKDYFDEHRDAYIYTPDRTIHLRLISAYYGDADPQKRRTQFDTQEAFDEYVQKMVSPCRYAQMPETPVETIYTLITCSYEFDDARTFLYGVEVQGDETE